ncbi:aldo/keto reductase [Lentinula boryana]|uniref:Aldo/keto reductase n=1 Tax=Lentinula boryana TaxID=40481 RepID=A0ABQ8Q5U3_9AGAR|nr:aldo/keto reductase [Lentinula boryana]
MTCVSNFSGLSTAPFIFSSRTPRPVSDEQAFEAIKAGIDALPDGVLNSGMFLGIPSRRIVMNRILHFRRIEKTFLSVKSETSASGPDGSLGGLRRSVVNIQDELGSIKKLDLFEPARIETQNSRAIANTLRKAHSVIYPVTAAKIEVSPWAYDESQKAVIAIATELSISVLAHSPLGQGFLTGQIKSPANIPEGDMRSKYDWFKEESFNKNLAIVNRLKGIAMEEKVTAAAQLCIAWAASLGPTMIPLPGLSKASRTLENLKAGDIQLTQKVKKAVEEVISI